MIEINQLTTTVNKKNKTSGESENIAIIGVNRAGFLLYNTSASFLRNPQRIVGFIKEYASDASDTRDNFPNTLGPLEKLDEIIKKHKIKSCIIAIDPRDVQNLHDAIHACEKENIRYFLTSPFYDVELGGVLPAIIKKIQGFPGINFRFLLDFLVSGLSIILFLPSFLVIALGIKLTSKGSVFCSEERVGKNGNIFRVFKFRTFKVGQNPENKSLSSVGEQPELTKFGSFLQRTRLVDLPVLINILIGDLSMIGPRAENPYFHEKYKREIPFYENRLKAKPGLISLAYVETGKNVLIEDVREKLKYDLFYIDHQNSLKVNLKILLKSNFMVFFSKQD